MTSISVESDDNFKVPEIVPKPNEEPHKGIIATHTVHIDAYAVSSVKK